MQRGEVMINGIEELAFLAGIILGSIQLLAVSWVWVQKQVLGMGGITMSFVGVALVGLALWSSIRIEASPDGFIAEFQQELEQLNRSVQEVGDQVDEVDADLRNVVSTNIAFNRDLEELNTTLATNSRLFVSLTDELERSSTVNNAPLTRLRESVVVPNVQEMEIRSRRETLEALQLQSSGTARPD
jgi:hypothetical protein